MITKSKGYTDQIIIYSSCFLGKDVLVPLTASVSLTLCICCDVNTLYYFMSTKYQVLLLANYWNCKIKYPQFGLFILLTVWMVNIMYGNYNNLSIWKLRVFKVTKCQCILSLCTNMVVKAGEFYLICQHFSSFVSGIMWSNSLCCASHDVYPNPHKRTIKGCFFTIHTDL